MILFIERVLYADVGRHFFMGLSLFCMSYRRYSLAFVPDHLFKDVRVAIALEDTDP